MEHPGQHRQSGHDQHHGHGGRAAAPEAPGDRQLDQLGEHDRGPGPGLQPAQLPGAPAQPDAVRDEEQCRGDPHGQPAAGEPEDLRDPEAGQHHRLDEHQPGRERQRRRGPASGGAGTGGLVGGGHGSRSYAPPIAKSRHASAKTWESRSRATKVDCCDERDDRAGLIRSFVLATLVTGHQASWTCHDDDFPVPTEQTLPVGGLVRVTRSSRGNANHASFHSDRGTRRSSPSY